MNLVGFPRFFFVSIRSLWRRFATAVCISWLVRSAGIPLELTGGVACQSEAIMASTAATDTKERAFIQFIASLQHEKEKNLVQFFDRKVRSLVR